MDERITFDALTKATGISDKGTLLKLYDSFFRVVAENLEQMKTAEGIELKELAHGVKGAAYNMWVEKLGDIASELEQTESPELVEELCALFDRLFEAYKEDYK